MSEKDQLNIGAEETDQSGADGAAGTSGADGAYGANGADGASGTDGADGGDVDSSAAGVTVWKALQGDFPSPTP